jgi:serine/threonine protein kinase
MDPGARERLRTSFVLGLKLQERYVLENELGSGGMGKVFLARDVRLNRSVAIKVIALSGKLTQNATMTLELRRIFEEEARLGANLNHPAIATVFDYGFHEDQPFTVFEYLGGETLQEVIARGRRITLDDTRLIVVSLAQALDFAHARHIVHRDLKPANIRATPQGYFKILDLGLAKKILQHDDWNGFAGTPAYASPEQAAALPLDGRSDQYALALIVYEMLTGRRPFQELNPIKLLKLHRESEVPDPRRLAPDSPETVHEALLRALQKNPNHRFDSCEAFAVALGCQLQNTVVPRPRVLLEANVRESFRLRHWHVVLEPNAVWADCDGEIQSWPIEGIADLEIKGWFGGQTVEVESQDWPFKKTVILQMPQGRELRFSVPTDGETRGLRRLKFSSKEVCREWYDRLFSLKKAQLAGSSREPSPLLVNPVVLLRRRPNLRFQLLGPIEVEGKWSWTRNAALRIRGALMQADAVIGLEEERIAGLARSVRRISGTAVRTIDPSGRSELKARWLEEQTLHLANLMLWFVASSLILRIGLSVVTYVHTSWVNATSRSPDPSAALALTNELRGWASIVVLHAWPLLLWVLIRGLRWPQLLPAAVLTFSLHKALFLLQPIGVIGYRIGVEGLNTFGISAMDAVLFSCISGDLPLAVMGLLLARMIRRTHRVFYLRQSETEEPTPLARIWVGRMTIATAVVAMLLSACFFVIGGIVEGIVSTKKVVPPFGYLLSCRRTGSRTVTNDLPDIDVSWVLNTDWKQVVELAMPSSEHTLDLENGLIRATVAVKDTSARSVNLLGDQVAAMQFAEAEFVGYFKRAARLTEPHPVQRSGITWYECQLVGKFPETHPNANYEVRFLLRTHVGSMRQVTVRIGCPASVWNVFDKEIKAAADGIYLGPSFGVSGARVVTNKFPDIEVSWLLSANWQEDKSLIKSGLEHTLKSTRGMTATIEVTDLRTVPLDLRGDRQASQHIKRLLVYFGHGAPSIEPQPMQIDGVTWFECNVDGADPKKADVELHLVVRSHADSIRRVTVVLSCPRSLWKALEDEMKTAADGIRLAP